MLEMLGIRFQNSGFLYLLMIVPFVFLFWQLSLRRKKQFRRNLLDPNLPDSKVRRTSHLSRLKIDSLRYAGFTLVLSILVAALAQPQLLRERITQIRAGVDTVLLLDLSYSMLAEDIVPSRLEKAEEVIRNFIVHKKESDRIGLVIFAENSLVLSYLSKDPENLLFYMDYLDPKYGTNMGRAIVSGLRVFERQDEIQPNGNDAGKAAGNSRLMILVSDGEDQGHELEESIAAAIRSKIRIYTIGIGSRRTVPIPVGSREGGTRQYLMNDDGSQVHTRFNEQTLRQIASRTGGKFYRSFVGDEMAHAFDDVLLKEREIKDFKVSSEYADIYPFLLMGSLGMFSLILMLDRQ